MKKVIYERNCGKSMFIPSNPALNDALQNGKVDGFDYDGATIESMRENNVLFSKDYSGYDKISRVQAEQLKNVPEVQKLAKQMQELKDYQTGQGRKR